MRLSFFKRSLHWCGATLRATATLDRPVAFGISSGLPRGAGATLSSAVLVTFFPFGEKFIRKLHNVVPAYYLGRTATETCGADNRGSPVNDTDDMTILSNKKIQMLAEKYGWSIARAEGYCKGEAARRRGDTPSTYTIVGIDEYALGFRAGYFLRESRPSLPERTDSTEAKYLRSGSS